MIHQALTFLKNQLSCYLDENCPSETGDTSRVDFIGLSTERAQFNGNKVYLILINTEEERIARPAEPYLQSTAIYNTVKVPAPIKLNLDVLVVAYFPDNSMNYEEALKQLSYTVKFFQLNPYFSSDDFDELDRAINRLVIEMIPMTISQQNEIWGMLKIMHFPSLLYKLKMLTFQDDIDGKVAEKPISETHVIE